MRQIRYNHASNILRFEYPVEWKGEDVSAITLTITDMDGTELLAAQSLTLYTATELDGAVAQYLGEITLDSGAGELSQGDPLLLAGAAGAERHFVAGYDATGYVVTLEDTLKSAHEDADAVYGLWGNYTLDTTTVATWTAGLVFTLKWTPTGSGQPTTELAQIAKTVVDIEGLAKRWSTVFSRAYDYYTKKDDRLEVILQEAEMYVIKELESAQLDVNRIVDQDVISMAIMCKVAHFWTLQGDEKLKDEREAMSAEYTKEIKIVKGLPIWVDQNQDLIEDDGEVEKHTHKFKRRW